jgi:hypothetical protein
LAVVAAVVHFVKIEHPVFAHLEGTDDKVFEAYQEILEQVASAAFDADASDEASCPRHQGSSRQSEPERLDPTTCWLTVMLWQFSDAIRQSALANLAI